MPDETDTPPSLPEQTRALGQVLQEIADADPSGTPTQAAADAFASWIAEAGPGSRQPDYFADVAQNYVATDHSNKNLQELFGMLEVHLRVQEEEPDTGPQKTFIGLPLLGS